MRGYRLGLWLCPPAFRREFGAEMLSGAAACLAEAGCASRAARRACGWRLGVDLVRTAATQWWGTGLPIIAALSILPIWLALALFARLTRHLEALPDTLEIHDVPLLTFELIVCTALLVVAMTIAVTLVFARPRRTPVRRPTRSC
jgi:hypothetical protein